MEHLHAIKNFMSKIKSRKKSISRNVYQKRVFKKNQHGLATAPSHTHPPPLVRFLSCEMDSLLLNMDGL